MSSVFALVLIVASVIAAIIFGIKLVNILGWTSTPGTFTVNRCNATMTCNGMFGTTSADPVPGRIFGHALQPGARLRAVDTGHGHLVLARTADGLWELGKLTLSLLALSLGVLLAKAIIRAPASPQPEVPRLTPDDVASRARMDTVALRVLAILWAAGTCLLINPAIDVPLRSLGPKAGLFGDSGEFTNRHCDSRTSGVKAAYHCSGTFRATDGATREAILSTSRLVQAGTTFPVVSDGAQVVSYPNRGAAWGESGLLLVGIVALLVGLASIGYAFSGPLTALRRARPRTTAWLTRAAVTAAVLTGSGLLIVIVLALVRAT